MFVMKESSKGDALAGLPTLTSRPTFYSVTTGQPSLTDLRAYLSNLTRAADCVWLGLFAPKQSYDVTRVSLWDLYYHSFFWKSVVVYSSAMTEEIKSKEFFTYSSKMHKDLE